MARLPIGGGLPFPPFRLRGGSTSPPWATVPSLQRLEGNVSRPIAPRSLEFVSQSASGDRVNGSVATAGRPEPVIDAAKRSWIKATELRKLRASYQTLMASGPGKLRLVVDPLFQVPVVRRKDIATVAGVTRQQAANYAKRLSELGILTGAEKPWGQYFVATGIFAVFFGEQSGTGGPSS